jgi:hypothetical protein
MITFYSHASQKLIVPTDYPTIQSAFNAANDDDVIFIEDGIYNENLILILNKNLTIEGNSDNVIIDASNQNRCLNVIGDTETLYTLSIKNVKFINGLSTNEGGAIKTGDISLSLTNVVIENCSSSIKAGAIFFQGEELILDNCRISNNSSQDCGGIFATGKNVSVISSTIEKNTSIDTWARGMEKSGGAVLIFDTFEILNCDFSENESFYGGGLWCKGIGSISQSNFINNESRAWMGAAFTIDGNATINEIEVNGNKASLDAAVVLYGTCTITNSFFNYNEGAVFHSAGYMTVENCKLINNEMAVITHPDNSPASNEITLRQTEIIYDANEMDISQYPIPRYAIKREKLGSIILDECNVAGYDYCIYNNNNSASDNNQVSVSKSSINNCDYGVWNNNGNITISNSNLCYNTNAVINKGDGSLTINGSNIYGNNFAVKNENDSKLIDCKNNYWGHESGPLHPLFNTSGLGDEVNEYVDVIPYSGQVNDIGVLHPITIKDISYLDNGFEINFHTHQNDVAKINIDCKSKYSDEQFSYEYDINNQIVIDNLPNGQYLVYASYVTIDETQSNKSFAYDFKHFNGEKNINVPEHYPTIETALAEAEDGYTIYVADGTYNESINYYDFKKNVNLIGNPNQPENVIINGQGKEEGCFWIRGSYGQDGERISVNGFTFTGGNGYYCGAMRFDEVSTVEINNCIVYGNTNSQGAIRFHSCTNSFLNHVLVYGNSGSYCGGVWVSRSALNVDRSTFVYNSSTNQYYGSDLYAEYCNAEVNNSIVWNSNNYAIDINDANILLNYCCVNSALLNQSITAANSIHSDPKFKTIEENDYSLSDDSPCIAAGDPNHELSTASNISIGYYDTSISTSVIDNIKNKPYKITAIDNTITIELESEQQTVEYSIYDLSGKLVSAGQQNNTSQITYNFSGNSGGVFIIHLRLKNSTISEKVLIKN